MLSKICKKTAPAEHGKGKPVSPKTRPKYNHAASVLLCDNVVQVSEELQGYFSYCASIKHLF